MRSPWRKKNYRPLSFTKGYGWRIIPQGKLHLSLGRGPRGVNLELPEVIDSRSGEVVPARSYLRGRNCEVVPADLWGEMQLCWDERTTASGPSYPLCHRGLSLSGKTSQPQTVGTNPMTLPTCSEERHLCHGDQRHQAWYQTPSQQVGSLSLEKARSDQARIKKTPQAGHGQKKDPSQD